MGRIPEAKIQEIKDRIDIVEVVSGYLPLKRSGVNNQGLCPFHQEKTASFHKQPLWRSLKRVNMVF